MALGIGVGNDLSAIQTDINNFQNIQTNTYEPTGFIFPQNLIENVTEYINIDFNDLTREFSISPVNVSYQFYSNGILFTKTGTDIVTIQDLDGTHFIYFDSNGVLRSSLTSTFFNQGNTAVAYIYWNSTSNKSVIFGLETHGCIMDWATHLFHHESDKCEWINGLFIQNYTLTGDGSADVDAQIGISNGQLDDEDLRFFINNVNSPTQFGEQKISTAAEIPIIYRDGINGIYDITTATTYPVKQGSSRIQYNKNVAGTWSAIDASGDDKFIAIWIIGTLNNKPIIGLLGQREDDILDDAKNNNTIDNLNTGDIPLIEFKFLYRLIYQTNSGYTNVPKCKLVDVLDVRASETITINTIQTSDHNGLDNRSALNSHPLSAISYSNVSSGYSSTDGQNVVDEIITKKADKVSGAINGNFAGLNTSGNITDSGYKNADYVHMSGNETISGIKTFNNIPLLPASNPITDNQVTRKKYVDDGLSLKVTSNTPIVSATKTKITYGTNGLVTSGTDATTADISDTLNKRYVTDSQLSAITHSNRTNLDKIDQDLSTTAVVTFAGANIGFVSSTEIGYLDGVTSAIQSQLNNKEPAFSKNTAFNQNFETSTSNIKMNSAVNVGLSNNVARSDHVHPNDTSKQDTITGAATSIVSNNLNSNIVAISDTNGKISSSSITTTKLNFLSNVTSDIQSQINDKEPNISKNTAFNQNFETNVSNIKMNNGVSLGSSSNIARSDHVHPTDTSKQNVITGAATSVVSADLTPSITVVSDANGKISSSSISTTTLNYISNVTSDIQSQLNGKEPTFSKNTAFNKNFETTASNIQMNGVANVGTSSNVLRADHVHPKDTTKQDVITGAASSVVSSNLNNSIVVVSDGSGKISSSSIPTATLNYISNVTSDVQSQLNGKEPTFSKNTAFNQNFETSTSNIKMNGAVSIGASSNVPRSDHVHPNDTSKQNLIYYGNMYQDSVAGSSITLTNQNSFYKWTGTTGGLTSGITYDGTNKRLVVNSGSDGAYNVLVTVAYTFSRNATIVTVSVHKDNADVGMKTYGRVSNTTNMITSVINAPVNLVATNYLELFFMSPQNGDTVTIYRVDFSIMRIG